MKKLLLFLIILIFAFFKIDPAHISDHLAPDGSKEVKEQKEIKENDEITKRYELISQCMNLPTSDKYIIEKIIKDYEDLAYAKYLNDHLSALKRVSNISTFPPGLPELIHSYQCITHEQWEKNNQDLIEAAKAGNHERIKELLDSKEVDVNYQDENGETALHYACFITNLTVVEILLNHHANCNLQNYRGSTALMLAVGIHKNSIEIINLLLNHKSNVNFQNIYGRTALMEACSYDAYSDQVKLLLEHGSYLNLQDDDGYTALMYASQSSFNALKKIKLLLHYGANMDLKNKRGLTALTLSHYKLNHDRENSIYLSLDDDRKVCNYLENFRSTLSSSYSSSHSASSTPSFASLSSSLNSIPSVATPDQPEENEGILAWIRNNPKKAFAILAMCGTLFKYRKTIFNFFRHTK